MFQGQHVNTLDDKGRVSMPAPFRKLIVSARSIVLTRSNDPCILGFTQEAWKKKLDRIVQEPMLDQEVAAFTRLFVANAFETPIDSQGRILIPPRLREYAGLEKEVLFAGRLEIFEVWHLDRWREAEEQSARLLNSGGGRLSGLI